MRTRKQMQRFLSIFLACIMILNVPMSALAFEDVMVVDALEDAEMDAEQEVALSEADGEADGQGGALSEEEVLIEDTANMDNSLENVANIETSSNANEDIGIDSGDDEWMFDDQASDEFEITDIEEYAADPGLEAEAVSLALVDELSETVTGEGAEITVRMTAQNGNAFLCPPYLELTANSNLSDIYGYTDQVTEGVSALDVLLAAHAKKYGTEFTKAAAQDYLTVDADGAVTKMFGQTAAYGTGIAVKCVIQETSAAALEVKSGETIAFFCYTDAAKSDKAVRFSTSSTAANAAVTESLAYAAENPKGIYLYDTEQARSLQLATVDAQTGALTAIDGLISNEKGIASLALKEGTYLITAYDTEAGVVMPILQYRAAKIPEISSLKVYRKDTKEQIAVTPEWDGKTISGYVTEAVPDSLSNFTPEVWIGNEKKTSSVTYDDVTYRITYSNASGQLTSSSVFWRAINGALMVSIDNMASRKYSIEVKRYATLKSLSVEGLNETFDDEVFAYNAFIPADAETCTITAGKYDNSSAISINGTEVDSGTAYELPVTWTDGKMEVAITVSNTSYESRTYTVTLYPKNTENTPKIVKQPVSAEYHYEDKASALSVVANGNGTLSYQWYRSTSESTENAELLENETNYTYTPDTTQSGTWYYFCKVTNTVGEETYIVNSDWAKVTVEQNPAPKITVTSDQTIPTIEGYPQEKGLVYEYGAENAAVLTATLSAEVEGGTWSNQRWVRRINTTDYAVTANEDGFCKIDTTALNDETGSYYRYCADYTYNGKTTSVESDEIFVYIRLTDAAQVPAPVFTGNFPSSVEYFVGATPQFFTGVHASVSIGTKSFKWYVNYIDSYDGADELTELGNTTQFKPDTGTAGVYYYFVAVTNTLQGYTNTVYTNTYKVTVKEQIVEGEYEGLKLKGSGTEDDPYLIENAEDYQTVYDAVIAENPLSFYGKYLKQVNDITLPKAWKPIGNYDRRFSGTLDGNGKTITIPEGGLPLIGYIQGAEVKNLNIYGKKIAGYGLVNNFEGVGRGGSAIVIDNVTLKSGSSTLRSGLIGANITENMFAGVSNGFVATIRNCTIEEGVVIGYNKDQSKIGSIAGRMQGYVENCVSYATVYGKDYVGGIIGCRDNAMGDCHVSGCSFFGNVEASGEHAGGIVGGGYENSTAPNGVRASVDNCSASGTVTGADKVGGIFGGDSYVACAWNAYTFTGNSFTGKVKATSGNYIGGIIGFYDSLNNKDGISGNYYSADCGASKGIGFVQYVDTNCKTHEMESGAIYINTSEGTGSMPDVAGCGWKVGSNRTDDPLGADAEKLATTNANAAPVVTKLTVSGNYKTEYYMTQDFDFTGMEFTATWSNGSITHPTADEMTVTGFDSSKAGTQEVVISYQGVSATVTVKVRRSMKVTFSLLGDSEHDSDKDGIIHTLQMNNLETWVPETVYYYTDMDTTVRDVLEDAAEQYGFVIGSRIAQYGYYVESITWKNQKLAEMDNGKNSGWMYTVNGIHPDVGAAARYVENGDVIIFHYTDDYTEEESLIYDQSMADETTETITSLPAAEKLSVSDKAAVQAARAAYEALTAEQKALVSAETLKLLEAAEARIAELEKSQHICSWDAGTVAKAASCKETGIKTYKCACGKTKTEVIEKAAHSYSKWTKVSDATVFAAEVQKHTCSVCGASETKNVGSKLKAVLELPGKLSSINIKKGNTKTLNVTMANGDSVISVKSSAPKTLKATLDKNGKITLKALKKGSAKLTIKLASKTEKTYTVKVVTGTVKTTNLTVTSVTNNKLTLTKGKTHTLKSELKPFTSTQKVTYKTSNKKVATVSSSGKIKAVGAGKATITVTSGSKKVKVTVTVPGITGLKSSVTVKKNKTTTLKPKAYGISEKVTYTSSNPKVATVTAAGKVKGIKKGTAKITVQAGSYKYTVTVKVK